MDSIIRLDGCEVKYLFSNRVHNKNLIGGCHNKNPMRALPLYVFQKKIPLIYYIRKQY